MACRDRWNTTVYFPYNQIDDLCILHLNVVVTHNFFFFESCNYKVIFFSGLCGRSFSILLFSENYLQYIAGTLFFLVYTMN